MLFDGLQHVKAQLHAHAIRASQEMLYAMNPQYKGVRYTAIGSLGPGLRCTSPTSFGGLDTSGDGLSKFHCPTHTPLRFTVGRSCSSSCPPYELYRAGIISKIGVSLDMCHQGRRLWTRRACVGYRPGSRLPFLGKFTFCH